MGERRVIRNYGQKRGREMCVWERERENLKHSHQLSQMCQMPNIWHIWHTKHKNKPSSAVLNVSKFWDMLQYALKYESIRTAMPFWFNTFLFSFLSLSLTISSLSIRSRAFSSLLKISCRLTSPSTFTALVADLYSSRRQPSDLLIESWVWDLGWV